MRSGLSCSNSRSDRVGSFQVEGVGVVGHQTTRAWRLARHPSMRVATLRPLRRPSGIDGASARRAHCACLMAWCRRKVPRLQSPIVNHCEIWRPVVRSHRKRPVFWWYDIRQHCDRDENHPSAPRVATQTPRLGAPGNPTQALRRPDGGGVRRVDPAIHCVQRYTASAGVGRARSHRLPVAARGARRECFHAARGISATRSRRTCSKRDTTSGRSKSSRGIAT